MNMFNLVSLFLSYFFIFGVERAQSVENGENKNSLLMKRHVLPTCELKPFFKKAILDLQGEVRKVNEELSEVRKTLKEISGILNKPKKEAKNCADLYENAGIRENGVYEINPDGLGSFKVFCDMKTSGGGWTVFQHRFDGSVDFFRGWDDYKNGFGNLKGEFWLGLDKIHKLTSRSQNSLRIDMTDTKWNTTYALYDFFSITGENLKYELSIGTYSGTSGDSLTLHNGQKFSTKDSDNDSHNDNCAASYKGAWWYGACHRSNLNGLYHHGTHSSYADGINWFSWKGYHYSLKTTSMKIRPRSFGLKK